METTSNRNGGMELSFPPVDHGPELSPAEECHDLSLPQFSMSRDQPAGLEFSPSSSNTKTSGDRATTRRRWLLGTIIATIVVVTIVILAIVLPLSLKHHRKKSSKVSTIPTTGAYNGTGMAILQLGTSYHDYTYHLYYQHATGELRDLELNNYEWVPASNTNVGLPASVKNGTPMAVASYEAPKSPPTYHIFYVDSSGILQETVNSGGAGNWNRGPLGTLSITPSDGKSVGLTACSDEPFNGGNVTAFELYYGDKDNLVRELIYNFGSQSWTSHFTFPNTTGNAGIACSASNTSLSYVFLSNINNELELWWKDSNNTAANTAANSTAHPLGIWSKVPDPAPITIYPNSSISRIRTNDSTNLIFFQDPSYAVKALQPVLNAENSTWGSLLDVGSAVAGPGTHMAAATFFQGDYSTLPNLTQSEINLNLGFHVFLQTNGSDITEYIRGFDGGQWTSDALPAL